jgi:hypothetical protein
MLFPPAERGQLITFQLWTAVTILVYGIVHDQWVMAVSADHFTLYHPKLIETRWPRLNTAALAAVATLGPGLVLGALLWMAARWGEKRPRLLYPVVWRRLLVLLACLEVAAMSVGFVSAWRFERLVAEGLLLPEWVYPEMEKGLVVAQTIQLFTYAAAAVGSWVLIAWVWRMRGGGDELRIGGGDLG